MHGEEQQLQIQQPNWQGNLDPQLLSRQADHRTKKHGVYFRPPE